jgi:hypothetical protein
MNVEAATNLHGSDVGRKWVKKNVSKDREMVGNVLKVERKYGWDVAFGMDCDGLRITSDTKAVLP